MLNTDPQSGQVPFPHWSVFALHPQSAWLVEVAQQVWQLRDNFSIPLPSLPSWVILSHTFLTCPTDVASFPTVLGKFVFYFSLSIKLPTALCLTATLCTLHTCSKLPFLDKACRQTSFIKVRTLGRAQLIFTYPWRTARWKRVCRCEQLK